ncbi:MAG: MBL fold metallo-hydrolase [Burkholderiaceae bacterium]
MVALLSRLILALCLLSGAAGPAQAAAARLTTQVPGFYRTMVGDFEITALYDGYVDLDQKLLKGATAKEIQSALASMFIYHNKGAQTAVNAYLINTGNNLVLVDSGSAECFGPTLGNIQSNLRAAGYTLAQVDTVLLTHLHPDHACGLLDKDGKIAYPNATVHVARADAEHWLNEATAAHAPADKQAFFKMARDAVKPYQTAGRFKTFEGATELLSGVRSLTTVGHTPGHSSFVFSSKGQKLLVWGDIVHSHAIQFRRPEVAIEFDSDSQRAIATRRQLFRDLASDKGWVAGAHLPFPGIGHIAPDGKAYRWVPIEFGPLRTDR